MSYAAIVAPIHVRPHPNADRLQIGACAGHQVIVGLDTKDGELGVFFPTDGQLSHEFCLANNLYNESARNQLGLTPEAGKLGFFDVNRRVRAQNFRGVKSDGFWVPLSYFDYLQPDLGMDPVTVGQQFTTLAGQSICEKYYTPATLRAMKAGTFKAKKTNAMFPKHTDTAQFRFITELPPDAVVYITEKLHGTSGRYGYVLDEQPRTFWQRVFRRPASKLWTYLNGSRNVVLEKTAGEGFYGTNEFRYNVVRDLQLRKGEVIFFEIVGYVSDDTLIMPAQDTTKLKDKSLEKLYGKRIEYTYGCQPGEHKLFVYKILFVNESGEQEELSWTQLQRRCNELGLQTVPLLWHGAIYQFDDPLITVQDKVKSLTDGPSTLGRHMREGVVIRIESARGIEHIKNKNWAFGCLDGYIKEDANFVDVEEAS